MRYRAVTSSAPVRSIITCADSRISPTLVFDVIHGNLFVSRIAGNTVDTGTLAVSATVGGEGIVGSTTYDAQSTSALFASSTSISSCVLGWTWPAVYS